MDFLIIARKVDEMSLANFPSKVPEALCHGVIPIVSRVGDYTKYYLEDGVNSIIFDGYAAEDCLNAINRVLEMSNERIYELRCNARFTAEKRFDYHNWSDKISSQFN